MKQALHAALANCRTALATYRWHLALAAGTALVAGVLFATGPSAVPEVIQEKAWPVSVVEAEPGWIQPAFAAYGRFEARRRSALSSDLVARISDVVVNEGDEVAAGDVLVRLDAGDLQRRLQDAEAGLVMARANRASISGEMALAQRTREDHAALYQAARARLERHRALLARRLISQVLFDDVASQAAEASIRNQTQLRLIDDLPNRLAQANAAVDQAAAALAQVRADLDETVLRAPFAGPVLAVSAAPGEMNVPGRTLIEMSSRESIELRLEIPDRYASRLESSLRHAEAVVATTPEGHQLRLDRMGRQVRAGQGGLDAFFPVMPASRNVAPPGVSTSTSGNAGALIGRFTEARVLLPAEPALLALPPESLYENGRIYQVVEQRLQATAVEQVGETTRDGRYRVLVRASSLLPGASILATQLPQAVTGLLVAPVNADPDSGDFAAGVPTGTAAGADVPSGSGGSGGRTGTRPTRMI